MERKLNAPALLGAIIASAIIMSPFAAFTVHVLSEMAR